MASYFNLTLDTAAPSQVALSINDGALYASSTAVTLNITLGDEDPTGYQMKIWGVATAKEEAEASWEKFAAAKGVNLTSGDGLKTVYLKVRDDVGNESLAVSDTITLNTEVPVVIDSLFQSRDFGGKLGLFLFVLSVQSGVSAVGQLS